MSKLNQSDYPIYEEIEKGYLLWWDCIPFVGVDCWLFNNEDEKVAVFTIMHDEDYRYDKIHKFMSNFLNNET